MSAVLKTLNTKEMAVYRAFPSSSEGSNGEEVSIADLAKAAFPKKGTAPQTKGNSWVRNSVRKLLRLGLVAYKGGKSGIYFRVAGSVRPSDLVRPTAKRSSESAEAA